jgi:O-succinylbenzoate synthase
VGDLADELSLMDDLLAVLPTGTQLRLDANGAWDRRKAERWLERCAERPIEYVEQPIAPDARNSEDLLLGLAGDFPVKLALDESLVKDDDCRRWLSHGWPGVYVLKPLLLADPLGRIAELNKSKADLVFSSAMETAVGAKCVLKLAFSQAGTVRALGFGVWPLWSQEALNGPACAPFIRAEDVDTINEEAAWNALS